MQEKSNAFLQQKPVNNFIPRLHLAESTCSLLSFIHSCMQDTTGAMVKEGQQNNGSMSHTVKAT